MDQRRRAAVGGITDTLTVKPAIALQQCPHGYHHPASAADVTYPHSCDGCWCEGWRDQGYGWQHSTDPKGNRG